MRGVTTRRWALVAVIAALFTVGCAGARPTPQQTGTAGGAAAGAATGALIGQAIGGKAGIGAALGGVLGGVIGNLIGSHLEAKRESTASDGERPRPEGAGPATTTSDGDPTKGELINTTAWLVRVWVDPEDPEAPEAAEAILLKPREKAARNLDVGTYRIVATAHAATQFGERLVGRFDRTIEIEARRPGWFLKFSDAEFR
jgi:hypothetical protein